jgi:6-phosphofructokinase 1
MTAIIRSSNNPYTVQYGSTNVIDVANKVKAVPDEFINSEGNYITDLGISYLRPLIIGEHNVIYSEGVPKHFIFPKI